MRDDRAAKKETDKAFADNHGWSVVELYRDFKCLDVMLMIGDPQTMTEKDLRSEVAQTLPKVRRRGPSDEPPTADEVKRLTNRLPIVARAVIPVLTHPQNSGLLARYKADYRQSSLLDGITTDDTVVGPSKRPSDASGSACGEYVRQAKLWLSTYEGSRWEGRYAALDARRIDLIEASLWQRSTEQAPPRPILDSLRQYPRLVIVGNGGAGKTTVLMTVLSASIAEMVTTDLVDPASIPVLVPLAHATASDSPLDLITAQLAELKLRVDPVELEERLQRGQFQLLFDGVNEISRPAREAGLELRLASFINTYDKCRVVLTTRRQGFDPRTFMLPTVELQPLTPSGVNEFLALYLDPREAEGVLKALGGDRPGEWERPGSMLGLARHPLNLWMIVQTYREMEGSLPLNRGALFHQFVNWTLGRQDVGKGSAFDTPTRRHVLAAFASQTLRAGYVVSVPKTDGERLLASALTDLKNRGLLGHDVQLGQVVSEMSTRVLGFVSATWDMLDWSHQVYQDYFAALHMTYSELSTSELSSMLDDPRRWDGVLAIVVGIASGEAAEQLVALTAEQDVVRAGRLLEGAGPSVSAELRGRVAQQLVELVKPNKIDTRRQTDAVSALACTGAPSLSDLLFELAYARLAGGVRQAASDRLVAAYPEQVAEVANRVLREGVRANRVQSVLMLAALEDPSASDPPTWLDAALDERLPPEVGVTAMKAVGERQLLAALPVVAQTLKTHRHAAVRANAATALGRMRAAQYADELADRALNDGDPKVRRESVKALRYAGVAERWLKEVEQRSTDRDVAGLAGALLRAMDIERTRRLNHKE